MPGFTSGGSTVGSAQIVDNEIVNADVNTSANIDLTKLNIANQIDNTELADEVISTAEVAVSSAEILSLFTTPKTLVAAPGAGKALILIDASFSFTVGGAQYAAGGAWRIQYNGQTTNLLPTMNIDSAINGAASFVRSYPAQGGASGMTTFANAALELQNASANHTIGNGTLKVFIRYRTITL